MDGKQNHRNQSHQATPTEESSSSHAKTPSSHQPPDPRSPKGLSDESPELAGAARSTVCSLLVLICSLPVLVSPAACLRWAPSAAGLCWSPLPVSPEECPLSPQPESPEVMGIWCHF
ncbi:hypothetical protein DPEC_G00019100 [Dallia pectoralis]|uniref:Uncharacterized protein n=1 Tax=Dallia pectoralis TaxID=75939 RepID=A0ACC2HFW9_DALPE|nr:hypothetical protein DPEC_G00019100 [Dallia pectoralis]